MRRLLSAALLACCALLITPSVRAEARHTGSGMALDAPWKVSVYEFARKNFHHPAWGRQHSERDYRLALEVAHSDELTVDDDVLFAAAMLHDMAAYPPYAKKGMEHGHTI